MMTPAMNKWQMALASSHQAKGKLYEDRMLVRTPGMCCLGVALYSAAAEHSEWPGDPLTYQQEQKRWLLRYRSMPELGELDGLGVHHQDDIDSLAMINDHGVPHTEIRAMLIDAWLTGDWTEIHYRSNTTLEDA